jgi:hypothetical protein
MNDILSKTGIYIAHPTSAVLKSIYKPKNYKTMVNDEHTKVGIAKHSFLARSKGYYSNFDNEVMFKPIVIIEDINLLVIIEKHLLSQIRLEFKRVGRSREWFETNEREKVSDLVSQFLLEFDRDKYQLID